MRCLDLKLRFKTLVRPTRAVLVVFIFAAPILAQKPGGTPPGTSQPGGIAGSGVGIPMEMGETGSIVVRVFDAHDRPLKQQAFVRLFTQGSGVALRGVLTSLDSSASFDRLPGPGRYAVEVSAAGYHTQRKEFDVTDTRVAFTEVDVTMQTDADNTSSSDLPRERVPAKAQKHVDKGVEQLRAGKMKEAQKEFTAAYNAAPKSAETNYLLGAFYLRGKDEQQAERYLTNATSIDPGDVRVLTALGHAYYQKADLKAATEVLHRAISLDKRNWEALWLLSEIDYRQHDFEKAREEAQQATEFGKGAANGAEFVEGLALAQLGRIADALTTLEAFLRDVPSDPNAATARQLTARLEVEATAESPTLASQPALASSSIALPASAPELPLPDWEPPGVDQEKLVVADGVTCPANQVIEQAGGRVLELVNSVNRISATERITHEELSTLGRPVSSEKRKFEYLVSIADSDSGLPIIDETREGAQSGGPFLDNVSIFGLADLPLVFHPSLRSDFQMTCEGLGSWQNHATWLVYFRQRPDRPQRLREYRLLDGSTYAVGLKGRAWIAADTYQIVRLEANLMKPLPQVGLGSEEDVIEYAPVAFRIKNTTLWLPSTADIYYYYRHRPFHRHQAFTDYALFSVSATEKIGQPNLTPEKNNHP